MKWQACHFTHLGNGWREVSNSLNTKSKFIWKLSWRAQHRNWLSYQEGTRRRESCQTKCLWVGLFLEQIIAKYWWLHWFPQFWAALRESVQEGRLVGMKLIPLCSLALLTSVAACWQTTIKPALLIAVSVQKLQKLYRSAPVQQSSAPERVHVWPGLWSR